MTGLTFTCFRVDIRLHSVLYHCSLNISGFTLCFGEIVLHYFCIFWHFIDKTSDGDCEFLPAEAFCGVLARVSYSRPVEPTGSGPCWDSNQMSYKQLTKQTPCSAAPGLYLSLGFLGPFTNSLKRGGCWSVSVVRTYPPRL